MSTQPLSRIVIIGTVLAIAGAAIIVTAGIGSRLAWWPFGTGFALLRSGTIAALAALPVLCWGAYATRPGNRRRGFGLALLTMIPAFVAAAVPLGALYTARTVPPIHDISTDLDNPPAFTAVLPLRGDGSNPVPARVTGTAAQQRDAYPDIRPVLFSGSPEDTFDHALAVARSMGWEIVSADDSAGRIEATDTTFWFGFKDDIVIRLTAQVDGTRVDVRSTSRVGRSDVGANAKRIRAYLARLTDSKPG